MLSRYYVSALWLLTGLILVAIVSGCTPSPKVTNDMEALAVAYGELSALARTVSKSHEDGIISDKEADRIKAQLQEAHNYLRAAKNLLDAGMNDGAQQSLIAARRLTLRVLKEMQE